MELSINLTIPDNEEEYIKALLKTKGLLVEAYDLETKTPIALEYKVTDTMSLNNGFVIDASA